MPVDMSAASGKPPARKQAAPSRARTASTTGKNPRAEAVEGIFQLLQATCMLTGQHADAAAIGMHGEPIAREVASLADENESVANVVDSLQMVGPYTALLAAVLPFAMQILANHGRIDHTKVTSVTDPKVLESRMQVAMERQAMEQLAQEQEELALLRQAQERMNTVSDAMRNPN